MQNTASFKMDEKNQKQEAYMEGETKSAGMKNAET